MEVFLRIILILLMVCDAACVVSSCTLESAYTHRVIRMPGDVIIAGILDIHIYKVNEMFNFTFPPRLQTWKMSMLNEDFYNFLTFAFAVDEINNNSNLLPNITLAYYILDSYVDILRTVQSAIRIFSRNSRPAPNYNCDNSSILLATIEGLAPAFSIQIANLFGMYKYPQLSFTSQDPLQSDVQRFPSFYRTVPNDQVLHTGILELLLHFGWTWIGIITPSDDRSLNSIQLIQKRIKLYGGCIEFVEKIPYINAFDPSTITRIRHKIEKSTTNVILVYGAKNNILHLQQNVDILNIPGKVWISTADSSFNVLYNVNQTVSNGSLHFIIQKKHIPLFLNFLREVDPKRFPDGKTFATWWDELCANRCPFSFKKRNCYGVERERHILNSHCNLKFYSMSYNVYNAVYAVAHAFHDMYFGTQLEGTKRPEIHFKPWKFHYFLKNVNFTNPLGERVYFNKNEMSNGYDIYNLVYLPNGSVISELVGNFNNYTSPGKRLTINDKSIIWDNKFREIPRSKCSNSCAPGYRMSAREGQPICCYDCLPCPKGKVTRRSDVAICSKCPEDQWPNEQKSDCIPKVVTFLSYHDPVGISLAITAIGFSLIAVGFLVVLIKHKNTPIVKANNRTLSFVLLISLTFSFLGTLTFIGRPQTWTCLLRQTVFGMTFCISVSSLLAKTLTVVFAFNVSRTGGSMQNCIVVKNPKRIVYICSTIQFLICLLWLIFAPPFPYYNTHTEEKEIIVECNEGSYLVFHCVLGYLCILAGISFIAAFLARKLPNAFNEAKYITFSMLVFFAVWLTFIPTYFSSKGKAVVAVEVFAILASNAGLLCCIFIPKCTIIILQPKKNQRRQLRIQSLVINNCSLEMR